MCLFLSFVLFIFHVSSFLYWEFLAVYLCSFSLSVFRNLRLSSFVNFSFYISSPNTSFLFFSFYLLPSIFRVYVLSLLILSFIHDFMFIGIFPSLVPLVYHLRNSSKRAVLEAHSLPFTHKLLISLQRCFFIGYLCHFSLTPFFSIGHNFFNACVLESSVACVYVCVRRGGGGVAIYFSNAHHIFLCQFAFQCISPLTFVLIIHVCLLIFFFIRLLSL